MSKKQAQTESFHAQILGTETASVADGLEQGAQEGENLILHELRGLREQLGYVELPPVSLQDVADYVNSGGEAHKVARQQTAEEIYAAFDGDQKGGLHADIEREFDKWAKALKRRQRAERER